MSDRYIYNLHMCIKYSYIMLHSYIVVTHRPWRRGDIPFFFLRTSQLGTNSGNDSLGGQVEKNGASDSTTFCPVEEA